MTLHHLCRFFILYAFSCLNVSPAVVLGLLLQVVCISSVILLTWQIHGLLQPKVMDNREMDSNYFHGR